MSISKPLKKKSMMLCPDCEPGIDVFDGAVTVCCVNNLRKAFCFDLTFILDHPHLIKLGSEKPPLHFHPHQEEYIEVLEGELVVEVEGHEHILTIDDGEFCVRPWLHHRLYPLIPVNCSKNASKGLCTEAPYGVTRFLLSGQKTREAFRLDTVFFQNRYAYQDHTFREGKELDIIQVMNMFDFGA